MIQIDINKGQIDRLASVLKDKAKQVPKDIATAINKTRDSGISGIAKAIYQEIVVTQKVIKENLKKGSKATPSHLGSKVTIQHSKRIPLKEFKASQNPVGVKYKIKRGGGMRMRKSAFMGPKPGAIARRLGGHAFRREGKSRLPIQKMMGVSPWGVFVKKKMLKPTTQAMEAELKKQIERRIRFRELKAKGRI